MRIVMMTNTFLPHVSGVAQSVARFSETYRSLGHDTLVVAPMYNGSPPQEAHVIRVPAVQRFNGSDFSVALPAPHTLHKALQAFSPELIHTHHPFLLGDTALRVAAARSLPLVYTYHTMYEQYTHYVPLNAPHLAKAVIKLTTGYANLCDHVIAPSTHVEQILRQRGVKAPITVIPSGVDTERFTPHDDTTFREEYGIPKDAFVVGHVGRLAPEKNLALLTEAVSLFLREHKEAHFVATGAGTAQQQMRTILRDADVSERAHFTGPLRDEALLSAYAAFDVFLFASKSETQGMVLVEAMAAGVPVVAFNAPPVDEVVTAGKNGLLVDREDPQALTRALVKIRSLDDEAREGMCAAARTTAATFDARRCAERALDLYEALLAEKRPKTDFDEAAWKAMLHVINEEWKIWTNRVAAAVEVVTGDAP